MDRGSLLSASRRPMSAGAWSGMSSTAARPGVRHASATPPHRKLYGMNNAVVTGPTDDLAAASVS